MLFGFWQLKTTVFALLLSSSLGQELIRACDSDNCYEPPTERRYHQNNRIDCQSFRGAVLDSSESLKHMTNENLRDYRIESINEIRDHRIKLGSQRDLQLQQNDPRRVEHRQDYRQVATRQINDSGERQIERTSRRYVSRQIERANGRIGELNRQDIASDDCEIRRFNHHEESRQVPRQENRERSEVTRELSSQFDDSKMERTNSRLSDYREGLEEIRCNEKPCEINSRIEELERVDIQNDDREMRRVNHREESRQVARQENRERREVTRELSSQFDDSEMDRTNSRLSDYREGLEEIRRNEKPHEINRRIDELERVDIQNDDREIRRVNRREESRQVARQENRVLQEVRREISRQFVDSEMERTILRLSDDREERRNETSLTEKSREINRRIHELERQVMQNDDHEIRRVNRREESAQVARREYHERQEVRRELIHQFDNSVIERTNSRLSDDRVERREENRFNNVEKSLAINDRIVELKRRVMKNADHEIRRVNYREEPRQAVMQESRQRQELRRELIRQFDESIIERSNSRLTDNREEGRAETRLNEKSRDNDRIVELKRRDMKNVDREKRRSRSYGNHVERRDETRLNEESLGINRRFKSGQYEYIRDSNKLQDINPRFNEVRFSNREHERLEPSVIVGRHFDRREINEITRSVDIRDERREASRNKIRQLEQHDANKGSLGPNAREITHRVDERESRRDLIHNEMDKMQRNNVRSITQRHGVNEWSLENEDYKIRSRFDERQSPQTEERSINIIHRDLNNLSENRIVNRREEIREDIKLLTDRHVNDVHKESAERQLEPRQRRDENKLDLEAETRQRRDENKFALEALTRSNKRACERETTKRLEEVRERVNLLQSDKRDFEIERETLQRNTENERYHCFDQREVRQSLEINSNRQHGIRQSQNKNKHDSDERIISNRRTDDQVDNRHLETERDNQRKYIARAVVRDSQRETRQLRDENKLDHETLRESAKLLNKRDTERRLDDEHESRREYLLRSVERNSQNDRDSRQRRDEITFDHEENSETANLLDNQNSRKNIESRRVDSLLSEERDSQRNKEIRQSRNGRKQVRERYQGTARLFDEREPLKNRLEDERESREINRVQRELAHRQEGEEGPSINEHESKRYDERERQEERKTFTRRTGKHDIEKRYNEQSTIVERRAELQGFDSQRERQLLRHEQNQEIKFERNNRDNRRSDEHETRIQRDVDENKFKRYDERENQRERVTLQRLRETQQELNKRFIEQAIIESHAESRRSERETRHRRQKNEGYQLELNNKERREIERRLDEREIRHEPDSRQLKAQQSVSQRSAESESHRYDERENQRERVTLHRRTDKQQELNELSDEQATIALRRTEHEARQRREENQEYILEQRNKEHRKIERRSDERKTRDENESHRLKTQQSLPDYQLEIRTHWSNQVREHETRIRIDENVINQLDNHEYLRRQEQNCGNQYSRNDNRETNKAENDKILSTEIARENVSNNERREYRFTGDEFAQRPVIFLKKGYIALGQGVLLAFVIMKTLKANDDLKHKSANNILKAVGMMAF